MNREELYLNAMIDVAYNALQKEYAKFETYWYDCLVLDKFINGVTEIHRPKCVDRTTLFKHDNFCPINTSKQELYYYFNALRDEYVKYLKGKLAAEEMLHHFQHSNKVAKVYKDLADSAKRATKEGNL